MTVHYQAHGSVALLTLDNPPINGLGLATRVALAQAMERALADPTVQAVVLMGAGRVFSGGADLKEFGTPRALQEPHLHSLIALMEDAPKPVLVAAHGVLMGGGLELALACHYRMAAPGTKVALPEVKIGLVPGAGGTQRLPRALGVEPALNMIASGEPVLAEHLAQLPGQQLFQRMATSAESLQAEALTFAAELAAQRPLPRLRDRPCAHPLGEAYFQFARNMVKTMAKGFAAPLHCVEAVALATRLPIAQGLVAERDLFIRLMGSSESRALRHLFLAERAAAKIADVPADTPLRSIRSVAVVGAGTMGSGIAMAFLNAGLAVRLLESQPDAVERGLASIRATYAAQVAKGKLSDAKVAQRLALLSSTLDYAALHDADLVIEAVFEDMAVKQAVFQQLDRVMKPGAILASNTSTLDLNRIGGCTARPQDVVGLHFFSPAHVMQLLEVVRGAHTAPDVLATVMALAKQLRKTAVLSGVCDGFIGNRMVEQYLRQAGFLLDEGCTPQQVDRAMEQFGFAMGPFRMSDLAGNDIGWAIRQRRYAERPTLKYSRIADRLCEQGRFGQKTGAGWYDYAPGRREARPSSQVQALIDAYRQAQGITPRTVADEEIVQRLVLALVNEAAHILEEGIASRASDIDIVYIFGYGFPAQRGGPLCYADELGLFQVRERMQRFAQNPLDDAAFWQPAPLLQRLLAQGRGFCH